MSYHVCKEVPLFLLVVVVVVAVAVAVVAFHLASLSLHEIKIQAQHESFHS